MDREKESPPERLPFCLDDTVGEIVRASQECPGVYYIAARKQDGKFLADEYYVVEKSSPAISKEAMAYGRMPEEDSHLPGALDDGGGQGRALDGVASVLGSYRTAPLSVTRHRMRPFHSTGSRPSSSTGRGSSSRRRRA